MEVHGTTELLNALLLVSTKTRKVVQDALTVGAGKIRSKAQGFCPISPTQAQKNRLRKTKRKVTRKSTATTRAKPGGLRRSIDFEVDKIKMTATIFVASNSEGGKYAARIHDGQGSSWNKLGPGSIAANKSGKVGGEFIERAIAEDADKLTAYIDAKLRKVNL